MPKGPDWQRGAGCLPHQGGSPGGATLAMMWAAQPPSDLSPIPAILSAPCLPSVTVVRLCRGGRSTPKAMAQ